MKPNSHRQILVLAAFVLLILLWRDSLRRPAKMRCPPHSKNAALPSNPSEKILILQFISNSEDIAHHLFVELRDAAYKLDRQNVMVGFVESRSTEFTRQLLEELQVALREDGVLCEFATVDEKKWPKSMYYSDRITYLAGIRNYGLELVPVAKKALGSLDKVVCPLELFIYITDIVRYSSMMYSSTQKILLHSYTHRFNMIRFVLWILGTPSTPPKAKLER